MYGKYYYVYIMSNRRRTVLYIGMTNKLERRFLEHKWKLNRNSFTARYNVCDLIYYEEYDSPDEAISREKVLKGWKRQRKIELIEKFNPKMDNLFKDSNKEDVTSASGSSIPT